MAFLDVGHRPLRSCHAKETSVTGLPDFAPVAAEVGQWCSGRLKCCSCRYSSLLLFLPCTAAMYDDIIHIRYRSQFSPFFYIPWAASDSDNFTQNQFSNIISCKVPTPQQIMVFIVFGVLLRGSAILYASEWFRMAFPRWAASDFEKFTENLFSSMLSRRASISQKIMLFIESWVLLLRSAILYVLLWFCCTS